MEETIEVLIGKYNKNNLVYKLEAGQYYKFDRNTKTIKVSNHQPDNTFKKAGSNFWVDEIGMMYFGISKESIIGKYKRE